MSRVFNLSELVRIICDGTCRTGYRTLFAWTCGMLGKFFSLDCDILLRKWIEDTWNAQKKGVTLDIGEEFVGICWKNNFIFFFFRIYKCQTCAFLFVFKLDVSMYWKIEQFFRINLFIYNLKKEWRNEYIRWSSRNGCIYLSLCCLKIEKK